MVDTQETVRYNLCVSDTETRLAITDVVACVLILLFLLLAIYV